MGDRTIVNQILEYIPDIDWSESYENEIVSVFETTIRYLGGLLSGYDFLSGPLSDLADDVRIVGRSDRVDYTLTFTRRVKWTHSSSKPSILPIT